MEVINMDPEVNNYLKNMQYSPPVISQLALEIMVNPPTPGDYSYKTHAQVMIQGSKTKIYISAKSITGKYTENSLKVHPQKCTIVFLSKKLKFTMRNPITSYKPCTTGMVAKL